jgi:hypothetical protein
MVASIPQIHSALNFLMHHVLMCYCLSQVFELCCVFKGSISYYYVLIFSRILETRLQHVLAFLYVYF